MKSESRIEAFFLKIILRISFIGTILITLFDFIFKPESIMRGVDGIVDFMILTSLAIALLLSAKNKYNAAVIVSTSIPLLTLFYSSIFSVHTTTASMAAVIAVGFSISILLDGTRRKLMHLYVAVGLSTVFFFQFQNPTLYLKPNTGEVVTMFVVYFTAYFIITYSAGAFKDKYDSIHSELSLINKELIEKSIKMELQNKELIESENQMNEINAHLEQIVEERTNNVKNKNAYLVKYAFANAHHVRGPLARILGLLQLAKMQPEVDYPFLFEQIEKQSHEIDEVLKTINKELEEGQDIFF
jgi:signal transduction histidine kinase